MAIFTPVTDNGRLWLVEDLLLPEHVAEILDVDWLSLPWERAPQQHNWLRRSILCNDPTALRLSNYFNSQLDTVNQAIGSTFAQCDGRFWVDLPGFKVSMHTDGHLPNSLQLYWIAPDDTYGTGFYHYKSRDSLLYQFASKPNTGYLILNHLDDDGSQPLQWHGMFNPVPAGTIRVSSYWQFS